MSKQNNIPRLRFPKFRETWKQKVISNLGEIVGGGTPSTTNTKYWDGNIDWYTPTEIGEKKYISNSKRKITTLGLNNSSAKLLPIGTILLTSRASIGNIGILQKIGCTNQGFQSIIVNEKNDCDFVYYMMICLKKELLKRASGSTFLEISAEALRNIEVILPDQDEQCKIGSFLSVVDNRIEGLEKMLHLQKKYKQGIMQRIFNQTIRFKDENGNQFPDWQDTNLGNVYRLQGGFAFKSSEFEKLGIPIIRISNIPMVGNEVNIAECVCYSKINNDLNYQVKYGDLLIAMSGATTGKTAIYKGKDKAYLNQRVGLFKLIDKENYYPFIYHVVESDNFKSQLRNTLVAGAQPNISSKDIESFIIRLPHKDEQKKIADFLSSLDAKIEATQKQMDIARQWKKGLLQQMFV